MSRSPVHWTRVQRPRVQRTRAHRWTIGVGGAAAVPAQRDARGLDLERRVFALPPEVHEPEEAEEAVRPGARDLARALPRPHRLQLRAHVGVRHVRQRVRPREGGRDAAVLRLAVEDLAVRLDLELQHGEEVGERRPPPRRAERARRRRVVAAATAATAPRGNLLPRDARPPSTKESTSACRLQSPCSPPRTVPLATADCTGAPDATGSAFTHVITHAGIFCAAAAVPPHEATTSAPEIPWRSPKNHFLFIEGWRGRPTSRLRGLPRWGEATPPTRPFAEAL